jgi:hypothetical protein
MHKLVSGRRFLAATVMVAAALAAPLLVPATANAATSAHIEFQALASGGDHFCLDDAHGVVGGQVDSWHCGAANNDLLWTFPQESVSSPYIGFFQIKSVRSGACLSLTGGTITNGTTITIQPCNASDIKQIWSTVFNDPRTQVWIMPWNGSGAQESNPNTVPVVSMSDESNGAIVHIWHGSANTYEQNIVSY